MAARTGPPPTPTRLRIATGNPGKRPINRLEPQPRKGRPKCPAWLSDEAKAAWKRIVPELSSLGVLTTVDVDALAGYCETFARWKAAELVLQHGMTYECRDDEGRVKYIAQRPEVTIAARLLQLMNRYAQEFGITPASRSRITVDAKSDGDDLDSFRNRRKPSA